MTLETEPSKSVIPVTEGLEGRPALDEESSTTTSEDDLAFVAVVLLGGDATSDAVLAFIESMKEASKDALLIVLKVCIVPIFISS